MRLKREPHGLAPVLGFGAVVSLKMQRRKSVMLMGCRN
jgi:hypothetical protein